MPDHERIFRLVRGWDEAAAGYDAYFVPRFKPWVREAAEAVADAPDGPLLVPCCGPFPELDVLAARFPGNDIVGIDLSAGMVEIAQGRAARWPNASVRQQDAAELAPQWPGRCAAVISVFGLQQLPEPEEAITSWFGALRPSGRLSVVFWPDVVETDGPFTLIEQVTRRGSPNADRKWDARLGATLAGHGAVIERDEFVSFPITYASAGEFFDASTRYGPMRPFANASGDALMRELRAEFVSRAPAGEWTHRPRARHIVARRS